MLENSGNCAKVPPQHSNERRKEWDKKCGRETKSESKCRKSSLEVWCNYEKADICGNTSSIWKKYSHGRDWVGEFPKSIKR